MKKLISLFFSETWFTKRKHILISIISIIATLPLIYGLVYMTRWYKVCLFSYDVYTYFVSWHFH